MGRHVIEPRHRDRVPCQLDVQFGDRALDGQGTKHRGHHQRHAATART